MRKKIKHYLSITENVFITKIATSILVGIILLITVNIVGNKIVGPIRCEDGWHSPSIGRQGACSHHGGVDTTPRDTIFFLSFVFSIGSGIYTSSLFEKMEKNSISEKEILKVKENIGNIWEKVYGKKPSKEIIEITVTAMLENKEKEDIKKLLKHFGEKVSVFGKKLPKEVINGKMLAMLENKEIRRN